MLCDARTGAPTVRHGLTAAGGLPTAPAVTANPGRVGVRGRPFGNGHQADSSTASSRAAFRSNVWRGRAAARRAAASTIRSEKPAPPDR